MSTAHDAGRGGPLLRIWGHALVHPEGESTFTQIAESKLNQAVERISISFENAKNMRVRQFNVNVDADCLRAGAEGHLQNGMQL